MDLSFPHVFSRNPELQVNPGGRRKVAIPRLDPVCGEGEGLSINMLPLRGRSSSVASAGQESLFVPLTGALAQLAPYVIVLVAPLHLCKQLHPTLGGNAFGLW